MFLFRLVKCQLVPLITNPMGLCSCFYRRISQLTTRNVENVCHFVEISGLNSLLYITTARPQRTLNERQQHRISCAGRLGHKTQSYLAICSASNNTVELRRRKRCRGEIIPFNSLVYQAFFLLRLLMNP